MNEEPLVKTASKVFQDLCYQYRDQLTAGIIVAGWDRQHGGQVKNFVMKRTHCSFNLQFSSRFRAGVLDSDWRNERANAVHDRRIRQYLYLRLRRRKLQEGHEQVGVHEVLHQRFVSVYTATLCCEQQLILSWSVAAVALAISRDGSSGGLVRLAAITKDGVERKTVMHDDLPKFFEC